MRRCYLHEIHVATQDHGWCYSHVWDWQGLLDETFHVVCYPLQHMQCLMGALANPKHGNNTSHDIEVPYLTKVRCKEPPRTLAELTCFQKFHFLMSG